MNARAILFFVAIVSASIAPALAACTSSVYGQFDFWLGNWRVTNAHGKLVGYDTISKHYGGCVLFEQWRDAGGPGTGFAMTGYDGGRNQWHQTYMDDSGFVLALNGSFRDGAMVLEGVDYAGGKARMNRGVWTRRGDAVEELWTISTDGGRTWKTRFDGFFRRLP